MDHRIVSQAEWTKARKAQLAHEKEVTQLNDQTRWSAGRALGSRSRRTTYLKGLAARKRCPTSLTQAASSSSTISCSRRAEGRLPRLLFHRRSYRRRQSAPPASRCVAALPFRARPGASLTLQEAHGLAVQMGVVLRRRLQLRLPRLGVPGADGERRSPNTITKRSTSRGE